MNKKVFDIYTDYLTSQNHHATATGLSKLLEGNLSHDQVTRFLHKQEFTSKDLCVYDTKEGKEKRASIKNDGE